MDKEKQVGDYYRHWEESWWCLEWTNGKNKTLDIFWKWILKKLVLHWTEGIKGRAEQRLCNGQVYGDAAYCDCESQAIENDMMEEK